MCQCYSSEKLENDTCTSKMSVEAPVNCVELPGTIYVNVSSTYGNIKH